MPTHATSASPPEPPPRKNTSSAPSSASRSFAANHGPDRTRIRRRGGRLRAQPRPRAGEGALVKNVRPESPAWDVGIEPGMRVLTVNGEQLTDMIVWLWEADDDTVELEVSTRATAPSPRYSIASLARTGV
ncbi:MAG: PDZ domain-containing protein [Collinsella sp.]